MSKTRINWLDNLRAIGIIFVVLGHLPVPLAFQHYIYSFHIPLFFFISGLFFSSKTIGFKEFVSKKFKSILVPYFVISFISYLIWVFFRFFYSDYAEIPLIKPLIGIFYATGKGDWLIHNRPLWFLPCLFISCLIFFFVLKLKSKPKIIFALIALSIVGCGLSYLKYFYYYVHLPWSIDSAITSTLFIGAGYLIKPYIMKKFGSENKKRIIWIMFITLLFSLVASDLNGRVDINSNYLGISNNYILFYAEAFSGIIFWLYISRFLPETKVMSYIGVNSIWLFGFHLIVRNIVLLVLNKVFLLPISLNYHVLKTAHTIINPIFIGPIIAVLVLILTALLVELYLYSYKKIKVLVHSDSMLMYTKKKVENTRSNSDEK